MEIILASRNPSKAKQIQTFFEGTDILVKTQVDAGIDGEAIEDGDTLEANARKKVEFVHARLLDAWVMADDTGLFIHAFNGEPGVQAAYWGGAELSTEERMNYCLRRLSGVADRRATFRTTVVVMAPSGEEHAFTGEVDGSLLASPRVPPQPKMPYSALFVPQGETKAWAEMTTEYENSVSHRGKAFAKVKAFLAGAAA